MRQIKTCTVRNAFSHDSRPNIATCDADGVVRVWDVVAGHYTVCHTLTKWQERRVRRLCRPDD